MKTMKRTEVKDAHENSVLASFIKHSASINVSVNLITRPEPPDAIVSINGKTTWIEITDAFINREIAESITTRVSIDKVYRSIPKEKRFVIDPDETFREILIDVIVRKYEKESIGSVYQQYGKGILLVGIVNPFSEARELAVTEKSKVLDAIKLQEDRFDAIYLFDVQDHEFHRLL